MGMFDYVKIDHVGINPDRLDAWQTKDTPDQMLTLYTITADGALTDDRGPVPYEGDMRVYTYTDVDHIKTTWVEWNITFVGGKVVEFHRADGDF